MAEVEKFGAWRQREALIDLAAEGPDFLLRAEGAAFIEQLHHCFAKSVAGSLAYRYGVYVTGEEIVQFTIELLLARRLRENSCVAERAAAAESPWGYLWTTVFNEWKRSHGTLVDLEDDLESFMSETPTSNDELTPIDEVVSLTFSAVSEMICQTKWAPVLELLGWAAVNPPQRLSYDKSDRIAAHRHCHQLTIDQVIAVLKICHGSRPRNEETSLMGQFLRNAHFQVSNSPSHVRALVHFKNEFRAGETGSRNLTDW